MLVGKKYLTFSGAESEGVLPTSTVTYHGTGGAESEGVLPTNTSTYCGSAFTGGAESEGVLTPRPTVAMPTQVMLRLRGGLNCQCIHRWRRENLTARLSQLRKSHSFSYF